MRATHESSNLDSAEEREVEVPLISQLSKAIVPKASLLYQNAPTLSSIIDRLLLELLAIEKNTYDNVARIAICTWIRASFETCLDVLVEHAGSMQHSTEEKPTLHERVLALRAFFSPNAMNCLYELEEFCMPTTTIQNVTLRNLRRLITSLLELFDEAVLFLSRPAKLRSGGGVVSAASQKAAEKKDEAKPPRTYLFCVCFFFV